ncbi:MAG: porin [Candidatus Loosdrechtia sp.]|uniref:porin n=1 Tax=Candidatus Loosdrechtia sp. TaxID=3101272 RepID=UPI003A74F7EE|nr:MAG: porin [Candidatus Jettenia sp. AMX2]
MNTEEMSENEIEDLKRQLKQMEESMLRQQAQIEALKKRIDSLPVKEEVKQEVESYLSSNEAREKKDPDPSAVTLAYTPDDDKYSLSLKTADNKYSLHFGARLQFQYTFRDRDREKDTSTLEVRRARVYFGGNIYGKLLHYYVSLDADRARDVNLRDFYVYWTPQKELNAKIGYFIVPFNRHRVTSSSKLLLIDRAIASEFFDQDRDYGLNIYGLPFNGHVEYHAAVFTGAGETANVNIDNKLMYVLSVRYNPFGKFDYYSDTDLAHSGTLKATMGAAVVFNPKLRDKPSEEAGTAGVFDFGLRYKGIAWENEYYIMSHDHDGGGSIKSEGFFTQLGYFVLPKKLELAARYSLLDPDKDTSRDLHREYTIGLNYYFRKHRSKIQSDFSHFVTDAGEQTKHENIFRIQYQIIF